MHGSASSAPLGQSAPQPTLSQRQFPRRVRALLEGILEYASGELERALLMTLDEYEQQLFKLAEQARSNGVQSHCFAALREVRRGRADVTPRFLIGLEAALAESADPPKPVQEKAAPQRPVEMALVTDIDMDEASALKEIANRAEVRSSLPLFLLGQRFAVIVGRPAFDAETLPIGPHRLCRVLRTATDCLELSIEDRLLLFRQFDRIVGPTLSSFYDALNNYLISERVLPHFTFVPFRARPTPQQQPAAAGKSDARASAPAAGATPATPAGPAAATPPGQAPWGDLVTPEPVRRPTEPQPRTRWPGTGPDPAMAEQGRQDAEMFDILRQLLASRRELLGKFGGKQAAPEPGNAKVATGEDVQAVLTRLQNATPKHVVTANGKPVQRSVTHLKQDVLAQLRQNGAGAQTLSSEDGDAMDLVGMLFDEIMKDVRPNSAAANLLTKLQVPLLRVALGDKGFFTRQQHPARQMLNAIVETGAYWSGEDAADHGVIDKMRGLVDRVTSEYNGDSTLFETLFTDLSGHLQTQVRKAEVSERRHVEAARGKEKLELARLHAAEAIDARLAGKRVPKFLHGLLGQAWSDVLALTSLRAGEDSDTYRHQLQIAERLIEAASTEPGARRIDPNEIPTLKEEIEGALLQVGYHGDDATAVATRLVSVGHEEADSDPASRTELAMRLKQRARFGQDVEGQQPSHPTELSESERAELERLKRLPFGTWFDFVLEKGETVRRRLSWFSPITLHALFVNHRGQRVGEYHLHWLAHEVVEGHVKIVTETHGSIVDRAWHAIVNALKSFTGRGTPAAAGGAA